LIEFSLWLLPSWLSIRWLRMMHVRVLLSSWFRLNINWWFIHKAGHVITKRIRIRCSLISVGIGVLIAKYTLYTLKSIKESIIVAIIILLSSFTWQVLRSRNCRMRLHLLSLFYSNWLGLRLHNLLFLLGSLKFLFNLLSSWYVVSHRLRLLNLLLINIRFWWLWCMLNFLLFFSVSEHNILLLLWLALSNLIIFNCRIYCDTILLIEWLLVMNLFLLFLIKSKILLLLRIFDILSTAVIWLFCFPLRWCIFHLRCLWLLHWVHHWLRLLTLTRLKLRISSCWTFIDFHVFVRFILLVHPGIEVLLLLVRSPTTSITLINHIRVITLWHRSSLTASRFTIVIMIIRWRKLSLRWMHLLSVSIHTMNRVVLFKSVWIIFIVMMMVVIFFTILVAVLIKFIHFVFLAVFVIILATSTSSIVWFFSIISVHSILRVPVIFFTCHTTIGWYSSSLCILLCSSSTW